MKNSDDIVNLFQQFGAKADPYQELARKQEHQRSSERWPLVSAVRGAVGDDVPAVNRHVGAAVQAPAPRPQPGPAPTPAAPPAATWPQPTDWVPRAAPQTPAPDILAPMGASASPPAPAPVTPQASRSPLASLAGLHAGTGLALRDEPAPPQAALPADLPSVFARLAGDAPPRPAAGWQPRKGHP
ncbi:cellulose biosynthesis protein BcsP [Acidovorax sp. FJL06]|uniref:cellulose biosynthesis protein BcsP n=1 Tax=Acidovorax sp. FJL06 TaxID=2153365 RepID=UPI000F58EA65|nr:cellulose biosynthesis protein BcsP [Acidovorax sp. FJL06]RQO82591.1 hypothetical protein DBV10_07455 [Acidovorax sp. FJL06]